MVDATVSRFGLVRAVARHIGPRRRAQIAFLALLMVFAAFAELLSIGAVIPFLAAIADVDSTHAAATAFAARLSLPTFDKANTIPILTALFCIGALVSGGTRYLLLYAQTRLAYRIGAELSTRMFEGAIHEPYLVQVSRNSGDIIAAIGNKSNELLTSFIYPLFNLFASGFLFAGTFAALMLVEPAITALALGFFTLLYGAIAWWSNIGLARSGAIVAAQVPVTVRTVQEGLGSVRDVIIDRSQHVFVDQFRRAERAVRDARASINIMSGTPRFIVETMGMLFLAGTAMLLLRDAPDARDFIPLMGVLALAAQRLIPTLQQAYSSWAAMSGGAPSVIDAVAMLDAAERSVVPAAATAPIGLHRVLRFETVSFGYIAGKPPVLDRVDFEIAAGETIGIVGATGNGKSTFLDLFMGLLRPNSGTISVDGTVIDEGNIAAWRQSIAHVPQHIFLKDASIAENIAFGIAPEAIDRELLARAISMAQLDEVIGGLPHGLETSVGERGVLLSGGQLQRIGIARALYRGGVVLVFDEATSALDEATETKVMAAIRAEQAGRTTLIVSHRPSSLASCDRVMRIENGRVASDVQIGSGALPSRKRWRA